MCVCVFVYVYVHIYLHTHVHVASLLGMYMEARKQLLEVSSPSVIGLGDQNQVLSLAWQVLLLTELSC